MSNNGEDEDEGYEVEKIVEVALEPDGSPRYLVKWEGFGEDEMSWEPIESFTSAKEILQEYTEKFNELNPYRKVSAFTADKLEECRNNCKMEQLFEMKFLKAGWKRPHDKDEDGDKENGKKKNEGDIVLANITSAMNQNANNGKRFTSSEEKEMRCKLEEALDYYQENQRLEEDCVFCGNHQSSVLCRKYKYYSDRIKFLKSKQRCNRCMAIHTPYSASCLAAVLICRICQGKCHVTATCPQNNWKNWH